MDTIRYDITAVYEDGNSSWNMVGVDLTETQLNDVIRGYDKRGVLVFRNENGVFMLDTGYVKAMKIVPSSALGIST